MRVTVKLFAILREKAGTGELALELPAGSTVADAAKAVVARFPAAADFSRRVAYAVNQAYASAQTTLQAGDEVAMIPPVSGG